MPRKTGETFDFPFGFARGFGRTGQAMEHLNQCRDLWFQVEGLLPRSDNFP
jgi:hypothetical protein